jgi:hypothetical protein
MRSLVNDLMGQIRVHEMATILVFTDSSIP